MGIVDLEDVSDGGIERIESIFADQKPLRGLAWKFSPRAARNCTASSVWLLQQPRNSTLALSYTLS